MRSLVCPLFCILAVFFFVLYLTQTRLSSELTERLLFSLALTVVITGILYGLYGLIRRLRPNKALWRIIFYLIILIVVLIVFSIPEVRRGISIEGERPIVFAVLCLIICGFCCTRSARSTISS